MHVLLVLTEDLACKVSCSVDQIQYIQQHWLVITAATAVAHVPATKRTKRRHTMTTLQTNAFRHTLSSSSGKVFVGFEVGHFCIHAGPRVAGQSCSVLFHGFRVVARFGRFFAIRIRVRWFGSGFMVGRFAISTTSTVRLLRLVTAAGPHHNVGYF